MEEEGEREKGKGGNLDSALDCSESLMRGTQMEKEGARRQRRGGNLDFALDCLESPMRGIQMDATEEASGFDNG
jgi:hypothetical protein